MLSLKIWDNILLILLIFGNFELIVHVTFKMIETTVAWLLSDNSRGNIHPLTLQSIEAIHYAEIGTLGSLRTD